MKVTIIGANGSVGRQISKLLMFGQLPNLRDLVLITRSDEGIQYLNSISEDALLHLRDIKAIVTKNKNEVSNSDLIIFCAGKSVPQKDQTLKHVLKNNREQLFDENLKILKEYSSIINNKSQNSLMILVSNPVSKLMQHIYKELNVPVIGVGITNDTLRIRSEFLARFGYYPESLFAIGEHSNQQNLTYTYSQLSNETKKLLLNEEKIFNINKTKEDTFSELKKYQNELLSNNNSNLFSKIDHLPLRYKVYSRHRCSHFISKTIMSTSLSILELIYTFMDESKVTAAEVVCNNYLFEGKSVLGVPLKIVNSKPIPITLDYSRSETEVLQRCSELYSIHSETKHLYG